MVKRRVTLVSKETSDAGKAVRKIRHNYHETMVGFLTDRTGQNEKVIVGQGSMTIRVEESIDVEAIPRILLEHL